MTTATWPLTVILLVLIFLQLWHGLILFQEKLAEVEQAPDDQTADIDTGTVTLMSEDPLTITFTVTQVETASKTQTPDLSQVDNE